MTGVRENAYDAVAYTAHSFAQTHPARLSTVAHLHGMTPAPCGRMRVLELGCGAGGNLVPMAFREPDSRFVGIDLAGSAIAQARAAATGLGLANVEFLHRDILDVGPDLGTFDYIIAHGVYSWVPDAVRERLFALYGSLLAPHGVGYVSYNALPGCRFRDIARDVMLFHTRGIEEPAERVRVARAALGAYAEASDPDSLHGVALRGRVAQLAEIPDEVLYHDDLNPSAQAFLLSDVTARAASHGLQFLAETSFPNRFGGARPAAATLLRQFEGEGADAVTLEQSLDLVIGRPFRESLFCRAAVPLRRQLDVGTLRPYHLAADARAVEGSHDPAVPGVVRFAFDGGVALSVDLPSCKAALFRLSAVWPCAIHHDKLVEEAIAAVGRAPGQDVAAECAKLADAFLALFRAGLLDAHLEAPRLTTEPAERPETTLLARLQAKSGAAVTDMRHRTVDLGGALVRKFVELMDGTRTVERLTDDLNVFLARIDRSGDPTGAEALPASVTPDAVRQHLRDVARLGLLVR